MQNEFITQSSRTSINTDTIMIKMKCQNKNCKSHESNHPDMDTADASVQWTYKETLDHEFDLHNFTIGCIKSGETSEAIAIHGKPRPYVRSISCMYCGEDFDDNIYEELAKITPNQIRETFKKMPFPESKINIRKNIDNGILRI